MTSFSHGGIKKKKFAIHVNKINEILSHKFHPHSILGT